MAKKDKRHPALRGYQVSRWVRKGILKVKSLYGTQVLVVQEAARVRLTSKYRTTISQGSFLVPRWVPAPKEELEKFSDLEEEELRRKGIVQTQFEEKGGYYLLIYQQVEDIDHLVRQQKHILHDEKRGLAFELEIAPYIKVRKTAAREIKRVRRSYLQNLRSLLTETRERKIKPPLKLLSDYRNMTPKVTQGVIAHLKNVEESLDDIIERPLVTRRKRAQRSIRSAIRWIRKRNFYLARKRLRKALENLTWPKK